MTTENLTSTFSKTHFIDLIRSLGPDHGPVSRALMIAGFVLGKQRTWEGGDYATHYLRVAMMKGRTDEELISIGILHDVVEDSDWTLDDLRRCFFSERVVNGVDSVTKRDVIINAETRSEPYFDFVSRCAHNRDGIKIKLSDLEDNTDLRRSKGIATPKQSIVYPIAIHFLQDVKAGNIQPHCGIWDYLMQQPSFARTLNAANVPVIAKYTSLPVPANLMQLMPQKDQHAPT